MSKKIKICHTADIHVRPHRYLDEMQHTFDQFLLSVKQKLPDYVLICGDFYHSKLTVSSEYFQIAFPFFKSLANIAPVIIIPGNHDSALTNQGRLDAITPIVNAVNDTRPEFLITYSRKSETFYVQSREIQLYDNHSAGFPSENLPIYFHHFSIYDTKESWPKKEDLDQKNINIALYHGAINNCIVDNGWVSRGNRDDLSIFDGFDFAMLGDIHKAQFLNDEKTIAYPGSLRQNNFGEDIDKGYLFWEIDLDSGAFNVERVILDQKRYFFTLPADSVADLDIIGELPKDSRVRVKTSKALDLADEISLKEEIVKRYSPNGEVDILTPEEDVSSAMSSMKIGNLDIIHENIRNEEVQRQLIQEYLKKKNATPEEVAAVLALDKLYHSHVDTDLLRDVTFTLNKIKWDNFFAYGKDNSINFEKLNGLIGIFGSTGAGKSSIFDVTFFAICNSIFKEANKNGDYVNRKCKRADVSLEIGLNGGKFVIDRGIKKIFSDDKPEPRVENSVDFYKLPKTKDTMMNGETGPDTNKLIRDLFGSKEDLEMLSHCSQFGLMNFIDSKGTKKKEILAKFFDLGVFDTKFDLALKDHKDIKAKLKDCNKIKLITEKQTLEEALLSQVGERESLMSEISQKRNEISEIENAIHSLLGEMSKVPQSVTKSYEKEIVDLRRQIVALEQNIDSKYSKHRLYTKEKVQALEELSKEISKNQQKLPVLEKQSNLLSKIPGVEACKSCELVKDSYKAQESVTKIKSSIMNSVDEANQLKEYYDFLKTKKELDDKRSEFVKVSALNEEFIQFRGRFDENNARQQKISSLKSRKIECEDNVSALHERLLSIVAKESSTKTRISIIDEKVVLEESLAAKDKAYSLYLELMGKDGISYWIISKKLSLINKLVNQILSHAIPAKFLIEDNEEEKSIKAYIINENGKNPIELASGGEKTIFALAIRAALWKVCLLPKMSILILDESLVFLDADKYDGAIKLLKYLSQEYFDKIFIITHNEDLKRVVDDSIYVSKKKGFKFCEVK